jgi:cytoskeletal protein RodZ
VGYLKCDKCGGSYELQEGESPEDFSDKCECGGTLRYVENLDTNFSDELPKKKITKKSLAVIGCSVFVLILVGAFIIYPAYASAMYNYHFGEANKDISNAKAASSQVDALNKPLDSDIQSTEESQNYTEKAIKEFQSMSYYAPDKPSKEYADLRSKQFQEVDQWDNISIRTFQNMQSSGTLAVALTFQSTSAPQIYSIQTDITSYQDQIVQLVESNPNLKQRRIDVLGEDTASKLGTYNFNDSSNSVYFA